MDLFKITGDRNYKSLEEVEYGKIKELLKEHSPIDLSIEKWEFIVDAYKNGEEAFIKDGGNETCALCIEYFGIECVGCPIREATGKPGCKGTPYQHYILLYYWGSQEELLEAAIAELEFLRGLKDDEQRTNN